MTHHQIMTTVLSRLADMTQHEAATRAGMSDAAVSKWKAHDLEPTARILAALGLKLVPAGHEIVDNDYIRSLETLARMTLDRQSRR